MSTVDAITVVIVDDHPVVRDGLSVLLGTVDGLEVIGTAAGGREGIRASVTLGPRVLVLDIDMPDLDGVSAAREITRVAPTVAILMLTMFDDDASVLAAMRAGARGYVLKGASQDDIVRAIRAVAVGDAIFGPGVAGRLLALLSAPVAVAPFPELTPRERQVLELLAAGRSTDAIGTELGVARKTVTNTLSSVFAKLQVQTRSEAIARAKAAGLGDQP